MDFFSALFIWETILSKATYDQTEQLRVKRLALGLNNGSLEALGLKFLLAAESLNH